MSAFEDPFEEEAAGLFEKEAIIRSDDFRFQAEALGVTLSQQLADALDAQGAFRLWDPDLEVTHAKLDAIEASIIGAPGNDEKLHIDPDQVIIGLSVRRTHEAGFVTRLEIVRIAKHFGQIEPAQEAVKKRELIAELKLRDFDDGWARAVDSLLDGPMLDIAQPEDYEIYKRVVKRLAQPDEGPLDKILSEVIDSNRDADESLQDNVMKKVIDVLVAIESARRYPENAPNAYAGIDELLRQAIVSREQAERLRAELPR